MTTHTNFFDPLEATQGPLPKGMGFWKVRSGPLECYCRASKPSEARLEAFRQWSTLLACFESPERISKGSFEIRLISGLPEIPGYELIFDQTVIKGDCLPEADSPLYRVINSEDDLDIYLLDVPSHATFTPPFRAHATSRGQWKCKVLDEGRDRASKAIEAIIDADRAKGYCCE